MPLLPTGAGLSEVVDFPLYLITDRHQAVGRSLQSIVRAALEGGVRAVQLREKDLSGRELFFLAEEMRLITREYGARLLINDRLDIALAVDADGVHLGAAGLPVAMARCVLGAQCLIGYSAHSVDEAVQAAADGADFVTFGPVYFTPSKASYGEPLGIELLRSACTTLSIPVFALGGINRENLADVMAAKAHGVAFISAVIAASDPKKEVTSILQMIEQHAINP